jgi:outer membrane protein, heavy metal efflux system
MAPSISFRTVALGSVVWLAGCSAEPISPDLAKWLDSDQRQWQMAETGAIHERGTLVTKLPDNDAPIPETATVEDYVRLAVERDPAIRAAQAKVRRMQARVPQESSLEDPMAEIGITGKRSRTPTEVMTGISQKLPFPGKLQTRGRIATQEAAMAEKELEQSRLDTAAEARQAFWSYYEATRALEVTEQSRDLLEQFQQSAEARYRANLASQEDVLRASVELSNLQNELIALGQQRTSAAAMLNSLLDRPTDAALSSPKQADLKPAALELDSLMSLAARRNPELAAIYDQLEAQRLRWKLARLEHWPDLTVSAGYTFDNQAGTSSMGSDEDQFLFGVAVNLPIWADRLRAAEREALAGLDEGVANLTATRNRLAFRVQDGLVRVQTQQRSAILLRDVILPQARQTVEASAASYRAGRADFLTVIDNWRNLLSSQLMYHQGLAQMQRELAKLRQAVGGELP